MQGVYAQVILRATYNKMAVSRAMFISPIKSVFAGQYSHCSHGPQRGSQGARQIGSQSLPVSRPLHISFV